MKIAELFYSLQGEGILIGVPSFFIRTSGCNLRCRWCDTPYTSWAPEGRDVAVAEILETVRRESSGYTVVTGGEPMIQKEIVELTRGLRQLGEYITIETAGTVFAPVACDLMSVSPKLANSTPDESAGRWRVLHEERRLPIDVLRRLRDSYGHQFKFVVENKDDIAEIKYLVSELGVARDRVVLMPEGTDAGTLAERGRWVAEISKAEGYRFSPRLHVDLWGNRRGV